MDEVSKSWQLVWPRVVGEGSELSLVLPRLHRQKGALKCEHGPGAGSFRSKGWSLNGPGTVKAAPGWWKEWRPDLTESQRKRKCRDLDTYLWNLCVQVEAATLGLSGPREGTFYVGI